jgi:hypothetical protein
MVAKSREVKNGWSNSDKPGESSKDGCGSKKAVLPRTMMIMTRIIIMMMMSPRNLGGG